MAAANKDEPDVPSETALRVADGLGRLSGVLRAQSWEGARARGITPTQGRILATLADARGPLRLGEVAQALDVAAPTASKAASTLVDKGLVAKGPGDADGRAVGLRLTAAGRREATRAARWTDRLAEVVGRLDADEQDVMLRAVVKMIRTLQLEGRVPAARTCVDCTHFRPFAHGAASDAPHHCAFVDAPFGDGGLQVACPDHVPAPEPTAAERRRRFLHVVD